MKRILLSLILLLGLVITISTTAEAITITSDDRGYYREDGLHSAGIENEIIGFNFNNVPSVDEFRTFYLFDLTSVTEAVTSAVLRLDGGILSGNPSETLNVWDVTSTIADLTTTHFPPPHPWNAGGPEIFDDLGSGVQYSSLSIDSFIRPINEFQLNAAAIQEINDSLGSFFAVGMSLDLISINPINEGGPLDGFQYADFNDMGFPNIDIQELVLTSEPVPEPTTIALLGIGLAGLAGGAVKRRFKRVKK